MTKTKKTTTTFPHFDLAALRETVGDKVLARGQAYHSDGRVEILDVGRNQIRARVAGTEIYQTELTGSGRRFSGACTCLAFEREDFCKHMVATALAVNAMDAGSVNAVRDHFMQIREHLRAKGAEVLADMVMGIAERDPDLRRHLELAVAMDGKDDETLFTRFKSAITEAMRTSDYIEYRQMRAWAANIEAVLTRLDGLIDKARAPMVLRLLDHFFARMDKALQSVDDSDDHGGSLLA